MFEGILRGVGDRIGDILAPGGEVDDARGCGGCGDGSCGSSTTAVKAVFCHEVV